MVSVPQRYVPKNLTKRDKKKQKRELKRSRRGYKKGKYYTRKKIKSFKSKISPHIKKAMKMYKVDKVRPSKKLAKATKCDIKGLHKIVKKGQGAYYSSGSRPNQTGHSWGYARLGSSITGGKASAVDYNVLKKYCKKNSRALKLAVKARKTYKKGLRRVKQVKMSGGSSDCPDRFALCFSDDQGVYYGWEKQDDIIGEYSNNREYKLFIKYDDGWEEEYWPFTDIPIRISLHLYGDLPEVVPEWDDDRVVKPEISSDNYSDDSESESDSDPEHIGGRKRRTRKQKKRTKRRTRKNILPKLRPITYKNKKHKYKLKDPFTKRKKAIHEGVRMESKKTGKSTKDAAIAKKGRFNVLRIYRRYNNVKDCNKITKDMRYMDKKYGLGKTKNICGKK